MTRAQEFAEKVAESKIMTAVARVAMCIAVGVGFPAGFWLVGTTTSHSTVIALHADRLGRLEVADQRDRERAMSDLARLNEIDRLLGRVEERTQSIIRDLDALRRRTSLDSGQDTATR